MAARIWVISDTHFKHDNIYQFIELDGRRVRARFESACVADAYMCERWRVLVRPEDHIYHLGDVTLARKSSERAKFIELMSGLPGHKRLIRGNHDHFPTKTYLDAGFDEIYGTRKLGSFILSHYPIHESSLPAWCRANVHGHIHTRTAPSARHINVCVEVTDYEPVLLDGLQGIALPEDMGRG